MEQQTQKVWTAANIVTLIRILCIPVFVAAVVAPWPQWFPQLGNMDMWKPIVAAAVFVAISCTDAIDGHLARSRNEVTTLGKFMDPLADKILVAAALLALIELDVLPSWVAIIILAREFIVSGIRMVAASQNVVIAASWYGKAKTVFQMAAILLFIVKDSPLIVDVLPITYGQLYVFSWVVMSIALVLTIVSMLDYFVKARDLLGFKKSPEQVAKEEHEQQLAGRITDTELAGIRPDKLEALASDVLDAARAAQMKVGTAESCTGGLIAGTLTAVAGSSDCVEGGIVSYSNAVKRACLGVGAQTLEEHGAVSEETAIEMAQGARRQLGVDVAVSVTGIAGPGGAVPGKPVGTVWIGVADAQGAQAALHLFRGNREQVRLQTVRAALETVLGRLPGQAD